VPVRAVEGEGGSMPEGSFDAQRLFRLMKKAGAEVLLASSRHNVRYLTGGYYYPLYVWDAHTRGTQYLPVLVIPADRLEEAVLVGRPGETEALEEASSGSALPGSFGIGTRPPRRNRGLLKASPWTGASRWSSLPARRCLPGAGGGAAAGAAGRRGADPGRPAGGQVGAGNPAPPRGHPQKPPGGGGCAHLGQGRGDHGACGRKGRPGVRQAGAAFPVRPGMRRSRLLPDSFGPAAMEARQPGAHRHRRHADGYIAETCRMGCLGWPPRWPSGCWRPAGAGAAVSGPPARRPGRKAAPRREFADPSSAATGSSSPTASAWCITRTGDQLRRTEPLEAAWCFPGDGVPAPRRGPRQDRGHAAVTNPAANCPAPRDGSGTPLQAMKW
jgi:hypothetical protein